MRCALERRPVGPRVRQASEGRPGRHMTGGGPHLTPFRRLRPQAGQTTARLFPARHSSATPCTLPQHGPAPYAAPLLPPQSPPGAAARVGWWVTAQRERQSMSAEPGGKQGGHWVGGLTAPLSAVCHHSTATHTQWPDWQLSNPSPHPPCKPVLPAWRPPPLLLRLQHAPAQQQPPVRPPPLLPLPLQPHVPAQPQLLHHAPAQQQQALRPPPPLLLLLQLQPHVPAQPQLLQHAPAQQQPALRPHPLLLPLQHALAQQQLPVRPPPLLPLPLQPHVPAQPQLLQHAPAQQQPALRPHPLLLLLQLLPHAPALWPAVLLPPQHAQPVRLPPLLHAPLQQRPARHPRLLLPPPPQHAAALLPPPLLHAPVRQPPAWRPPSLLPGHARSAAGPPACALSRAALS